MEQCLGTDHTAGKLRSGGFELGHLGTDFLVISAIITEGFRFRPDYYCLTTGFLEASVIESVACCFRSVSP